jgi:hypothetical protein
MSGYCECLCRDCFEIAIENEDGFGAFCLGCKEAGCEQNKECCQDSAYGVSEFTGKDKVDETRTRTSHPRGTRNGLGS